jgi:hypothetical protein
MDEPKENKGLTPSSNKSKMKVRILQNRAIEGVGKAGDVVELPRDEAEQYIRDGYVAEVKE